MAIRCSPDLTRAQRRELGALRMSALGIGGSADVPALVRSMLAIQAQDLPAAKWAVGMRTGASLSAVEAALATGDIVRSWPMRGTLHLLPPEDLRWMLAITRVRLATGLAKRRSDLGISAGDLATAARIAVDALSGGRRARRDELLRRFTEGGVAVGDQRGYHLLLNLAIDGLIVFGPHEGSRPVFVLLEEWIRTHRQLDGDEALGEFALRYFIGHGPATVQDFAWWAGVTLGQARTGLALAADQLEQRRAGGTEYWSAPGLAPAPPGVHLLPGFDEFVLGYQDRSVVLDPEFADRIIPGNNGMFQPAVIVNALVAGSWRRPTTTKDGAVEPEWFTPPSARAAAGARRAAQRYTAFLRS